MEGLLLEIKELEHRMINNELSKTELIDELFTLFNKMAAQEDLTLNKVLRSGDYINKLVEQNKRILELYQEVLKKQFGVWLSEKDIVTITNPI